MKLFDEEQYSYLEYSLKEAFHEREIPELSLRWKQDVISAVRRVGVLTASFNPALFVQRLAWRFVTVACFVVVMLFGYIWYFDLNPFHDVNELLLDDSVQMIALQQDFEDF